MDPSTQNEEKLIESILHGTKSEVESHLKEVPSDKDLARDLRELKDGLQAIEDDEPPRLSAEMLHKQKAPYLSNLLSFLPADWYLNPFVLCLGTAAFLLFMYILIAFVLK